MADFDLATGALTLPWWAAIALAALFAALLVLAILRAGGGRALTVIAQAGAVALLVFAGMTFLDRMDRRDRAEERRAFDARLAELSARAMAPGSALGCLEPSTADALEESCEKALFGNAESIAAATAYEAARLALLSKAVDFEINNPGTLDEAIAGLRRGLERDRYGIVAHIFAARDGCKADECEGFELLKDTSRVIANMRSFAFETRVGKMAATASIKQPEAPATPALASAASNATPNANFPSASTIPAVSIMNNEPGQTGQNGMDDAKSAKADARPEAKSAVKRDPEKPAPKRAQGPAPMQIAPARADSAARVQ